MADERWHPIGLAHEGQRLTVNGVDVWDPAWRSQARAVPIAHPQYPAQAHTAWVYEWPGADPPLLLAIAEVSANVYAFAVSPSTTEVARG